MPGFILDNDDGEIDTIALDIRDCRVVAIYAVRNPDKLQHLPRQYRN
jgi:RNA polymerase sigma-70 factor (ECF subfamily)